MLEVWFLIELDLLGDDSFESVPVHVIRNRTVLTVEINLIGSRNTIQIIGISLNCVEVGKNHVELLAVVFILEFCCFD